MPVAWLSAKVLANPPTGRPVCCLYESYWKLGPEKVGCGWLLMKLLLLEVDSDGRWPMTDLPLKESGVADDGVKVF